MNGDLNYTAPPSGSADMFTYTVSDPLGDTANGNVNVTLDPSPAKNDNLSLVGAAVSRNLVDGGDGNLNVSVTGNNNTVLLSGGNDNFPLTGNNNAAVVGNDNDNISLLGGNGTLALREWQRQGHDEWHFH